MLPTGSLITENGVTNASMIRNFNGNHRDIITAGARLENGIPVRQKNDFDLNLLDRSDRRTMHRTMPISNKLRVEGKRLLSLLHPVASVPRQCSNSPPW